MTHHNDLADRVRAALADQPAVREARMFGGLSFMVNERKLVSVRDNGELLVRADPARTDELLKVAGARLAEMGAGRTMSNGWIMVDAAALASDSGFAFWLGVALEYRGPVAGTGRRKRQRRAETR